MPEPRDRVAADEPRSPWLRGGFVLAAAFVGFVTVIGAALAVGSDNPGEDDAATPPRTPETRTSAPAADGGDCPELTDRARDIPAAAPADVTWTLYGSVALPSSRAAGPAVTDDDVARCYARTPLGALLATSQISVRYLAAGDWREVTRAQTVGAGRDAYIADRGEAERTADADGATGAVHGQIAGFRFVTYHDTTAVIQTVWRFPDGRMQSATTTVLWRDGDWKLEYPADPAAPTPVDSLAGYTAWGGV
ncbi:hypothetical protein [Streptomyces sp. B93]|uniref:hypothetical protein n=1 Tax=Streptomyces sp. B93 TaxID=2824875 RepID=UPI001B391BEF|nr:hypothetical protein [Streptomyces sp. B93]MBQ1094394.1 hypothetical protein [Streptomyces sp. B93]